MPPLGRGHQQSPLLTHPRWFVTAPWLLGWWAYGCVPACAPGGGVVGRQTEACLADLARTAAAAAAAGGGTPSAPPSGAAAAASEGQGQGEGQGDWAGVRAIPRGVAPEADFALYYSSELPLSAAVQVAARYLFSCGARGGRGGAFVCPRRISH